jgi:hypothetical protein
MFSKNHYPYLLRLLGHSDVDISSYGIGSIFIIIISQKDITPDNSPHPHFEAM